MTPEEQKAFLQRVDGRELFRLFDLLADVAFFIKDRRGRFVVMNRRCCEVCGVSSEREGLGKTDRELFPLRRALDYERDDRALMDADRDMVNQLEGTPELEGSPRLVITSKIPLHDRRGRVIGLAGFSRRAEQTSERPVEFARFAPVMKLLYARPQDKHPTERLARLTGVSPSQFDRLFRRTFGASVRQYLLRIRVEMACRRLSETNDTVARIAAEEGFYDHAHFSRLFQRIMGLTPAAYRREHRRPSVRKIPSRPST